MSKQTAVDILALVQSSGSDWAAPNMQPDEAQKALYELCVAALPKKTSGAVDDFARPPYQEGFRYGKLAGKDEAIDQSIEALARVFNQESV